VIGPTAFDRCGSARSELGYARRAISVERYSHPYASFLRTRPLYQAAYRNGVGLVQVVVTVRQRLSLAGRWYGCPILKSLGHDVESASPVGCSRRSAARDNRGRCGAVIAATPTLCLGLFEVLCSEESRRAFPGVRTSSARPPRLPSPPKRDALEAHEKRRTRKIHLPVSALIKHKPIRW
jgi:hypothetical protein